jgi:PAS domain S-box-containing protein
MKGMELDQEALGHLDVATLRALVNQMTEGLVIFDPQGRLLEMNRTALEIHGYEGQDQLPRWVLEELSDLFALFDLEGRPLPLDRWPISRVLRGEKFHDYEVQVTRCDTGKTWISSYGGTPVYEDSGQMILAIITLRDVTERKQEEEAFRAALAKAEEGDRLLRQRGEQLRLAKELAEARAAEAQEGRLILEALMDHIPMGIAIAEAPNIRIRMVSRWGRELLGVQPEGTDAVLEDPVRWKIFRNQDDPYTDPKKMPLSRAVLKGEVIREEIWYLARPDGVRLPVLVTASPIRDGEGRITGGVVGWQDIRERLQFEERLRHFTAEVERSNRELEQFAYVASHDLQEPLRMVTGFLQLLEDRCKDQLDEKALEYIAYAVGGAGRMRGLIESLLEYSRVGGKVLECAPVNLEALLSDVLLLLKGRIEESGARITHDPLPELVGDGKQLAQVFQNLIGNALKFRGGRRPDIHIGAERQPEAWAFSVRDNGIGFDPAQSERIFELFQRLHSREEYEGTGMGLAICKKIVERHGGRLWVESTPGVGSTFRFTIPHDPAGRRS